MYAPHESSVINSDPTTPRYVAAEIMGRSRMK